MQQKRRTIVYRRNDYLTEKLFWAFLLLENHGELRILMLKFYFGLLYNFQELAFIHLFHHDL